MVNMQNSVVLNASFIANANVVYVAANCYVRPDTGSLANDDVANDLCAGIDIGGVRDARGGSLVGTDHWEFPVGGDRVRAKVPNASRSGRRQFLLYCSYTKVIGVPGSFSHTGPLVITVIHMLVLWLSSSLGEFILLS